MYTYGRLDFIPEVINVDKDKGIFTVKLTPNPRRYDWTEKNGKRFLYDKLERMLFPEELIESLIKQAQNVPFNYQPPLINNAEQYVESRISFIRERLEADEDICKFIDKSEEFLESLSINELKFVIMSVDIVGSTKMAIQLEPKKYAKLISTTLYEMSEIIPLFHGYVLKYTGDGLIAYFPEPGFITKNDLSIDCALTINRLVYKGLNSVFRNRDYPNIGIRIGLDSGEAFIKTIGSPRAKQHKDIIGEVVSLAAKIQNLAKPGEILIGEVTARNLHTMWREICEEIKLHDDWPYKIKDEMPYKVYKVKKITPQP